MGSTRRQRPESFKDFNEFKFHYPYKVNGFEIEYTFRDYIELIFSRLRELEEQQKKTSLSPNKRANPETYDVGIGKCMSIIDEYPEYFI